MKQIHIVQFLPSYPPRSWGLETHAKEWAESFVQAGYGKVYNIIPSLWQEEKLAQASEGIFLDTGEKIGYIEQGVYNLVVPATEIISNYPVYHFWSRRFKQVLQYLHDTEIEIGITRTRFFLSSCIGGVYLKWHKIRWVHVEHGSDFVKLNSFWKEKIARIYDATIWKRIFRSADSLVWVSQAAKKFIQTYFCNREVEVIYRGLEISNMGETRKQWSIELVFFARLYPLKWLDTLLQVMWELDIQLTIIWDGPSRGEYEDYVKQHHLESKIHFQWMLSRNEVIQLLQMNRYIVVHPSYQEGLPTAVIESLATENVVVASDVGGTKEITTHKDLLLFPAGDTEALKKQIQYARKHYDILVGRSCSEIKNTFLWKENIKKYYQLFSK